MSYKVTWNDGKVRTFEVEDRPSAERMARAYPNLVVSFEKVAPVRTEPFRQCEPDPVPENRMITPANDKHFRKRKE